MNILDISYQYLTEFPKVYPRGHPCEGMLIDYTKIEYLNCTHNNFTSLPGGPNGLRNCEILICSGNDLTSLPDCLRMCKMIDCSSNNLTSLPDCLENCEVMDCSCNHLASLPACLEKCEVMDCDNQLV